MLPNVFHFLAVQKCFKMSVSELVPKTREDNLPDTHHQWTFAIPCHYVFVQSAVLFCAVTCTIVTFFFLFSFASCRPKAKVHRGQMCTQMVNICFYWVLIALCCSLSTTVGNSIAFSDYTHFSYTLNKKVVFPNVSSKLVECCKTFRHFFFHGRAHLFCEVGHLK